MPGSARGAEVCKEGIDCVMGCPSVCLSVCPSVCLPVCLSVCLSVPALLCISLSAAALWPDSRRGSSRCHPVWSLLSRLLLLLLLLLLLRPHVVGCSADAVADPQSGRCGVPRRFLDLSTQCQHHSSTSLFLLSPAIFSSCLSCRPLLSVDQ
jgi:hypothetical protein